MALTCTAVGSVARCALLLAASRRPTATSGARSPSSRSGVISQRPSWPAWRRSHGCQSCSNATSGSCRPGRACTTTSQSAHRVLMHGDERPARRQRGPPTLLRGPSTAVNHSHAGQGGQPMIRRQNPAGIAPPIGPYNHLAATHLPITTCCASPARAAPGETAFRRAGRRAADATDPRQHRQNRPHHRTATSATPCTSPRTPADATAHAPA
jgi:hypothetical protein